MVKDEVIAGAYLDEGREYKGSVWWSVRAGDSYTVMQLLFVPNLTV